MSNYKDNNRAISVNSEIENTEITFEIAKGSKAS